MKQKYDNKDLELKKSKANLYTCDTVFVFEKWPFFIHEQRNFSVTFLLFNHFSEVFFCFFSFLVIVEHLGTNEVGWNFKILAIWSFWQLLQFINTGKCLPFPPCFRRSRKDERGWSGKVFFGGVSFVKAWCEVSG